MLDRLNGQTTWLIERLFWATYRGTNTYNLNPAQWAALRFFARPDIEKRTSSEFAKFHRTTRGTANQTVLALIRRGYLMRSESQADQRSKNVVLTDEGRKLLESDPIFALQSAVETFNHEEQRSLERALASLHDRLNRLQQA